MPGAGSVPVPLPRLPPRQHKNKNGRAERSVVEILGAGFVAGAISRTATAPMDRLRSLMAAGHSSTLAEAESGIIGGIRAMYQAGGLRCMWQGNLANVLQVGPESALLFLANDMLAKAMLGPTYADDGSPPSSHLSMGGKFACGAGAGIFSMTCVYPMYVVQNRMMVASEGLYSGIIDCIRQTYRAEGLRAFSQGYLPSLVRIVPYKGIDLAGYHMLREYFVPAGEAPSTMQSLAFGAVASSISQTVTHPLLLARTKLQCQGEAMGRPVKYQGLWDAIYQTFQRGKWQFHADAARQGTSTQIRRAVHGVKMLWSGWGPSMAKNVPAIAIQFAVYERTLCAIDWAHDEEYF